MEPYDWAIDPEDQQDDIDLLVSRQAPVEQQSAMPPAQQSGNPVADAIIASMLKRQQEGDAKLQGIRNERNSANSLTNLMQAITQIGTGIAGQNADPTTFDAVRSQNNLRATEALTDAERNRKAVSDAIRQKTLGDYRNQSLATKMAGIDASQKNRSSMDSARVARIMESMVSKVENDPILKPAQLNKASLEKSRNILNQTDVPLTPQMLSDAEQDIASALTLRASGGVTEGKIKRTELNTLGRKLSEIMQYYGDKPVNLRTVQPALVEQIRKTNQALMDDYDQTINARRKDLISKHRAAYGDDPMLNQRMSAYEKASQPEIVPDSGGEKVRVISPEGKTGFIPKANLEKALSRGYKRG